MKPYILLTFILLVVSNIYAQTDTLIFKNGNVMVGEVKSMNRGVIVIETDYSDSDFKIEWEKVSEIYSRQEYIISLDNGERMTTTIQTDPSDKSKLFLDWSGAGLKVINNNVVYVKLGYTLNYDSQPVEGASKNDYVFQTTFGWEL